MEGQLSFAPVTVRICAGCREIVCTGPLCDSCAVLDDYYEDKMRIARAHVAWDAQQRIDVGVVDHSGPRIVDAALDLLARLPAPAFWILAGSAMAGFWVVVGFLVAHVGLRPWR